MSAAESAREIRTDTYSYAFSPYPEPIARVRQGELLDVYTDDAFESRVQTVDDLPSKVLHAPGPEPADRADLRRGRRARRHAVRRAPRDRPAARLRRQRAHPVLRRAHRHRGDRDAQRAAARARVHLSAARRLRRDAPRRSHPVRAVPRHDRDRAAVEAISSLTPGAVRRQHGCRRRLSRQRRPPARARRGRLLLHRGCPCGPGRRGAVRRRVRDDRARARCASTVEKGTAVAWPRIESPTELMSVGSARPMEDAARIA